MVDYDEQYRRAQDVCGEPFPEFVSFFDDYSATAASVLDLGCGQGRDALKVARRGHSVLGIDLSPVGIEQMLKDAAAESLRVNGVVADILEFKSRRRFDIVILDRVLHLLPTDTDRRSMLNRAATLTRARGFLLAADTAKHREPIRRFFDERQDDWQIVRRKGDFVFVQKRSRHKK